MRPRRARTSARSLATLRLELFDDGRPFAARAQQPLDRLAERPLAAARVELPRRRSEHLGCRIGRRRRDRRAQHRREVGEVIAEVKNLLESNAKLFGYALALGQLVRRPLATLSPPPGGSSSTPTPRPRRTSAGERRLVISTTAIPAFCASFAPRPSRTLKFLISRCSPTSTI